MTRTSPECLIVNFFLQLIAKQKQIIEIEYSNRIRKWNKLCRTRIAQQKNSDKSLEGSVSSVAELGVVLVVK